MEGTSKVRDILVGALAESIKSIDTSIVVAFLSSSFIVIQGMGGNLVRELSGAGGPQVVRIPFVGFDSSPYGAALFALALFWIFTLRAYFRARRAQKIVDRLALIDLAVLEAALLSPSLATGSRGMKVLTAVALWIVAALGHVAMYWPLFSRSSETTQEAVVLVVLSGLSVVLPPLLLARGLILLSPPTAEIRPVSPN